jgi:DoxX
MTAGGKMQNTDNRLNTTWWALRVLFGFVPIAAGLDKYFNFLTNWETYLNPLATKLVPVTPATFMHIVGAVEIIAGIVVLSRFTKIGSYVVMVWLVAIAVNLLTMGKFLDVAVRDLGLAVAAFSLAQLSAVREESTSTVRVRAAQPLPARS